MMLEQWVGHQLSMVRFEVVNYLLDLSERTVLDVGCGDGGLFLFAKLIVTIKDDTSEMIKRGVERYPGISIRQCNF